MNTFTAIAGQKNQQGSVLFLALIILVGLSMIGLTSMSSSVMEEKMAQNFRQEDVGFQAATSALRWGEFWLLGQQSRPPSTDCTGGDCDWSIPVWGQDSVQHPETQDASWWTTNTRKIGRLYENWGTAGAGTQWTMPGLADQPKYIIEETNKVLFGTGLEGQQKVQNFVFFYKVAASGVGEVNTGPAVVESVFVRRYGSN